MSYRPDWEFQKSVGNPGQKTIGCWKHFYLITISRELDFGPGEFAIFDRPFRVNAGSSSLSCGQVSLEKLAGRYGTPLYVYSGDQIVQRVEMFTRAFDPIRPLLCYSVKANSALAILKLIDRHGGGFDIVSGGELERVLTLGKEAAQRVKGS